MPTGQVASGTRQREWSSLIGRAPSGTVLKGDPDRVPVATTSSLPARPNQVRDTFAMGASNLLDALLRGKGQA